MRRRKAFTLVELLVLMSITAILIAILLPVCIKVRTRALILVCPIAYVGEDEGVYLTDPKGGYSLRISEPGIGAGGFYLSDGHLSWSPWVHGLAYNAYDPAIDRFMICF